MQMKVVDMSAEHLEKFRNEVISKGDGEFLRVSDLIDEVLERRAEDEALRRLAKRVGFVR